MSLWLLSVSVNGDGQALLLLVRGADKKALMHQVFNMVRLRGVLKRELQFGSEYRANNAMTVMDLLCGWRERLMDQTVVDARNGKSRENAGEKRLVERFVM